MLSLLGEPHGSWTEESCWSLTVILCSWTLSGWWIRGSKFKFLLCHQIKCVSKMVGSCSIMFLLSFLWWEEVMSADLSVWLFFFFFFFFTVSVQRYLLTESHLWHKKALRLSGTIKLKHISKLTIQTMWISVPMIWTQEQLYSLQVPHRWDSVQVCYIATLSLGGDMYIHTYM